MMKCCIMQWLNGIVLDLTLRRCWFEPNQRHCVVSLSKTHYSLFSTGSTLKAGPDKIKFTMCCLRENLSECLTQD